MMNSPIESAEPLSRTHLPAQLVDRESEQETLSEAFAVDMETRLHHLHLYGPRGSGKTHLVKQFLTTFPSTVTTCFVAGRPYNTQYKVLEKLLQQLTGERLGTGHHVSDLQRRINDAITISTVIVLDDIEFVLLNDGDDLLYFLSRLDKVAVITVSSNYRSLESQLDARTASSFQPQVLTLNPYTPSEAQQILAERARLAFKPQSIDREALSQIARTTANIAIGLAWLRMAANQSHDVITPDVVDAVKSTGYAEYVTELLDDWTPHHRRLYETIALQDRKDGEELVTGMVYDAYRDRCLDAGVPALSERRISDFLVQLELLDLIETTYHYGGSKGKTREIRLADWTRDERSEES